MKNRFTSLMLLLLIVFFTIDLQAQNPIVRNMYSADPTARVFGDNVYLFPSHDILATPGHGRVGWFCMEDYHVFSSSNLVDWTDHGLVVTQNKIPWVKPDSYSMWAPDCIYRNGKYYFYFPTTPKDSSYGRGFAIGVAIADKPEGPYIPQSTPIKNVHGIDPNVFIDKDGQAYLYWAGGNIYVAKLKENMLELDSEPKILGDLPNKGLKEGPYLFERNGIYYLTYPHVENKIERLEYSISDNPLGPFKVTGVIMDESPTGCWTNHQSIIQFKNQWYLFYHDRDYSPNFDKARSVRADSLFFNNDGTIKKVVRTFRGIGIADAAKPLQIDRYSAKSNEGVLVDFIDTTNRFEGWKTIFTKAGGWIQYNSIDFGKKKLKSVNVRVISNTGGVLELRLDNPANPAIAQIEIPKTNEWKIIKTALSSFNTGIHHLFVTLKSNSKVEIDWISFE
jgi:hypothetical protein